MAWNTGWRARYTLVTSPLSLSAFARLLAVVFNRIVSAFRALPETSNTLNKDMLALLDCGLLSGDHELQFGYPEVDEIQAGLVAHVVLGECRLLHGHFHGVAVQRGLVRIAVFQFAGG